ncbi:uncharacterized protein [Nicotiana tomentosiformis]|uniref:uncharacterized protein n=1 Tax=Nicotiana tomentosiformis TaxID=4098 RepID=UPI00388CC062
MTRAHGLCYWYDEKYTPNHKCNKRKQLFILELDEGTEDEEWEENLVDEETFEESTLNPQVSMHALNGTSDYRTMRVKGAVKVAIADGNKVHNSVMTQGVTWKMQGMDFRADMLVIPLGGADVVLQIQWPITLGDIRWNFKLLRMEFQIGGRKVSLRGSQPRTFKVVANVRMQKMLKKPSQINMLSVAFIQPAGEAKPTLCSQEVQAPEELQQILFEVPSKLPPHRNHDHRIVLKEGTSPINVRPYRYPACHKDKVERMIKEMLESGIIRSSMSPFSSHIVMQAFDILQGNQLFVKINKCSFGKTEVDYLGHIITQTGVTADPEKVKVMMSWPTPQTIKVVMISGTNKVLQKTYDGLWNDCKTSHRAAEERQVQVDWRSHRSFPETEAGYEHYTYSLEFVIEVDACGVGIGVVLIQAEHPLAYMSKALSTKHQQLSVYEKIQESYKGDPHLEKLLVQLQTDPLSNPVYMLQEGVLYRKGKIVVGFDPILRKKILQFSHDSAMGGHSGMDATLFRINRVYYWAKMKQDVYKHIRNYEKSVILVVVDRLSKYAQFIVLAHPYTASTVAQVFLDNMYKLHGLPQTIVSDRDIIFLRKFWQALFETQRVQLHHSSAYHPQSDGQIEVVNKCVEGYLRCMCNDQPKNGYNGCPLQNCGII